MNSRMGILITRVDFRHSMTSVLQVLSRFRQSALVFYHRHEMAW